VAARVAALALLRRPGPLVAGEGAWIAGAGYLVGAFALTLWMRALSRFDVPFGAAVALPLVVARSSRFAFAWRRDRYEARDVARAAARMPCSAATSRSGSASCGSRSSRGLR
jgi:hypothetical protein